MTKMMMSDLSGGLTAKILSRVPMTSLRSVRSTCKKWNDLSKSRIFCKTAARNQFLGFMMMDKRVCSIKLDLQGGDLVDTSIRQISVLDQIEVSKVFHCDGLLLCIMKDKSRLLVWNPYLGQTRWIQPRIDFHIRDSYAIGYDKNRNHKILRFVDYYPTLSYQVYDFTSNSWRILDVTPDWNIEFYQGGVSLMGNTYFYAQEKIMMEGNYGEVNVTDLKGFLLCFEFTAERFGPRLPLPFHSHYEETVTLSCVREEKLAVLFQRQALFLETTEIWVTTKIEPNAVSWSKFLKLDMRLIPGIIFDLEGGSFFIDEEKKLAVVFDLDGYIPTDTCRYQTAHIIGQDGYFKSVNIGEAPNLGKPNRNGYTPRMYCIPFVCSSYLPSLVEIN